MTGNRAPVGKEWEQRKIRELMDKHRRDA